MSIKKIALGSAQFGMSYGISNKLGQPGECEVTKILEYASKQGVDMLDTAPSYGNSESVIGGFIRSHSDCKHWNVITKVPVFKNGIIGSRQVDKLIESFELSRNTLRQELLYGLLIHSFDDIFLPGGARLLHAMEELKEKGIVKKIGVSLYSGEQIDRILDNHHIDLVQLPVNILDQRLIDGGQLKRLKKHGVEIHVRSAFLQGLLLMKTESISSWFDPIRGALEDFHAKARKLNMSTLQLALGFVQSINEVDKVVVGVNTLGQLHEIINSVSVYVNTEEFSDLSVSDPIYLNPSNWKK